MLGKRQSGALYFKIADLQVDADLLPEVQRYADDILRHQEAFKKVLTTRWLRAEQLILA
jgi:RecG-like helicase